LSYLVSSLLTALSCQQRWRCVFFAGQADAADQEEGARKETEFPRWRRNIGTRNSRDSFAPFLSQMPIKTSQNTECNESQNSFKKKSAGEHPVSHFSL
jgi:hypothetical protein